MTTDSAARPTTRPGPAASPPKKPVPTPTLRRSAIGQKILMAVTGLLMVAFLVLHMIGNLKIFFGREEFDSYAEFLRRIGSPALPESGFLWVQRVGLVVILVVHFTCAYLLTRRDKKARPIRYQHKAMRERTYSAQTMRWGGVILLLFIVYHILDMTTLTLNPNGVSGAVYDNVVSDFQLWYVTLAYTVAMIALGLHMEHGFWSAGYTLGATKPRTMHVLKVVSRGLAVLLTAGFLVVPWAVFTGILA